MEFRLLGTVSVDTFTGPLPLGPAKRRSLLAALLLSANTPVSISRLTDSLWDDTPPLHARSVIQGHVSRLRALLVGADAEAYGVELVTLGDAYVLRLPETLLDSQRFEELLTLARGQRSPADAVLMLKEALSLWQGPALSGAFAGRPLQAAAHSLEESRLATVEQLARAYADLGEHDRAAAVLRAEAVAHPMRESLAAALMTALYRAGRQSEALDWFHRTRRLLADELGIDPGHELADAYALILRGAPGPDAGRNAPDGHGTAARGPVRADGSGGDSSGPGGPAGGGTGPVPAARPAADRRTGPDGETAAGPGDRPAEQPGGRSGGAVGGAGVGAVGAPSQAPPRPLPVPSLAGEPHPTDLLPRAPRGFQGRTAERQQELAQHFDERGLAGVAEPAQIGEEPPVREGALTAVRPLEGQRGLAHP
ncbi:AfsR/SARP family transcriptional regulator, partial [Streptomyces sanglieri]|uniref:AfsR/SARP family transcriptional regulator n=1 Tax=Streptomyces sanglieri TaxID=193460 RepID=UPI0035240670